MIARLVPRYRSAGISEAQRVAGDLLSGAIAWLGCSPHGATTAHPGYRWRVGPGSARSGLLFQPAGQIRTHGPGLPQAFTSKLSLSAPKPRPSDDLETNVL